MAHSHTKKISMSVLFLLLLAGAGVTAYLTMGPFGFFGHSQGEIERNYQFVTDDFTQDCSTNPSGGNPYKFCEATCPSGYYAVNGSCQTNLGNNGSGNFVAGLQYTLMGVLPESGLRSYSCFNNEIVDDPTNYLTATATCMQSGGASFPLSAECGNYRIDTGEVCDKDNLGDWLDCTDFMSSDGTPLCNGTLSCAGSCGAFDVSACVYCGTGPPSCGAGEILCNDGVCDPTCTGHGGPFGGVPGNQVGPSPPNPPAMCPGPGPCPAVPPGPGPGAPSCPNNVVEPPEECEGSATGICARIKCPDGTFVCQSQLCVNCRWQWEPDPCGPGGCEFSSDCGFGQTCELGVCVAMNV